MEEVRALATRIADDDPAVGLQAVAALRRVLDRLEQLHVGKARKLGWSWQQIAESLGVTKQAVHAKHASRKVLRRKR